MMHIKLLYFAWVRETIGTDGEIVDLPAETNNITALLAFLAARSLGHGRALSDIGRLRFAVNQNFASPDAILRAGDEVAIFPPVTGG